jgi:acetoacetyl-CoA synthetase
MNGSNGADGTLSNAKLLWKHPTPQSTPMYQFLQLVNKTHGLQLLSYRELHQWSVDNINDFWLRVWEFVGVRHEGTPLSVSVRKTSPSPSLIKNRHSTMKH